jgi:phage replication O-like protein O
MADVQVENGHIKIANELIDALCKIPIGLGNAQILLTIFRKTYGWNKKMDRISISQFCEQTGMSRRNVIYCLKRLESMNMITVERERRGIKNDVNLVGIQKDYDKWVLPNIALGSAKNCTSAKSCQKVVQNPVNNVQKIAPTKDTITKDNTKDRAVSKKQTQQHQEFIIEFGKIYEDRTGQEFKADKHHYIMVDRLIHRYGFDTLRTKASILASRCENCDIWFTKNEGWSAFTIESMSRHWNSLIPQVKMSEQEIKNKKLLDGLERLRVRDERIDKEINATTGD